MHTRFNVIYGVAFLGLAGWLIVDKIIDARRVIDEPEPPIRWVCGCTTDAPTNRCSSCGYVDCLRHYNHQCAVEEVRPAVPPRAVGRAKVRRRGDRFAEIVNAERELDCDLDELLRHIGSLYLIGGDQR